MTYGRTNTWTHRREGGNSGLDNRGSTTMGERIEETGQQIWPVMILCPEPGFKPSFFKNHGLDEANDGIEKYFWTWPSYRKLFENATSMPDIFQNMSYILGQDWTMIFSDFR